MFAFELLSVRSSDKRVAVRTIVPILEDGIAAKQEQTADNAYRETENNTNHAAVSFLFDLCHSFLLTIRTLYFDRVSAEDWSGRVNVDCLVVGRVLVTMRVRLDEHALLISHARLLHRHHRRLIVGVVVLLLHGIVVHRHIVWGIVAGWKVRVGVDGVYRYHPGILRLAVIDVRVLVWSNRDSVGIRVGRQGSLVCDWVGIVGWVHLYAMLNNHLTS